MAFVSENVLSGSPTRPSSPGVQPLRALGATAFICSHSYLFRAGPDAASHPPLCSQPENGYMCQWQDKKGKFYFLKSILENILV